MANSHPLEETTVVADAASDYGSDLGSEGEQELRDLLTTLEAKAAIPLELESLEVDLTDHTASAHVPLRSSPHGKDLGDSDWLSEWRAARQLSQEIYYDAQSFLGDIGQRELFLFSFMLRVVIRLTY